MKNILLRLQLIVYASVLATLSYGQITTPGISKILYYEPFNFFINPETVGFAESLVGVTDTATADGSPSPSPGWAAGAVVTGPLTLDNHWDNTNQTDYVKGYSYNSQPYWRDNFLGLWKDKTEDLTFAGINIKNKKNLALSFANANQYSGSAVPPIVSISVDGGQWIQLTATGYGTSWLTGSNDITFTGIILPIVDLNGTPLTGNTISLNFKNSSDHNQIDDIAILGDDAPLTSTGPTLVPVTVYYEPFNLSLNNECYPCYASTMTGWADGAIVGGQMTVEPYAYTKSYSFTTQGTDDFIGFWGDKYTDITFSGINISGVSDLAINFGLAQNYMTNASNLPQVEISIDGSDWLNITKAGNGTQWGVTFFGGTFTGVSLPIKYASSPLTGDALSVRFFGYNGGQLDDLKIVGTTVAGVVSTTTGIAKRDTLYYEPFNLVGFGSGTTQTYANTVVGWASGATVSGPFTEDNSWSNQYFKPYVTVQDQGPLMGLWGDHLNDATFAGINVAGKVNLAISFGLAQNYSVYTARPQIFISIDSGPWIPITATGFGTAWPSQSFTPNSPVTFTGIVLPLVDQNGSQLTGSSLSINIKNPADGSSCQVDDIRISGETPVVTTGGNVSVTGITVAPAAGTGSIVLGNTLQLNATVLPSTATLKTVTWTVTPISTNGSVSASGLFTPVGSGTAIVTATAKDGSGKSGSFTVTVTAQTFNVTSIVVAPADPNFVLIHIGETAQFVTHIQPSNATDSTVTWSVISPSGSLALASIDQTGLLTTFSETDGGGLGTLRIVATANDPLGRTDTLNVRVAALTDIDNSKLDPDFTLYPNPASTDLTITNAQSVKSVVVYDMIGVQVSSAAYLGGHINVSNLASGTYFVKINTLSGKTRLKTFIKY